MQEKAHSGIFYRQNEPYLVKAEGPGINMQQLVFSPSFADTAFLPVKKTFFADNEADFTFTDGVPTKYKQSTSGEAIALVKLPADIFSAYFAAIGSVFDAFKTNDTKEKDALTQSMKLELAKLKYDACIKAITAKDNDALKSLGCEN